MNHRESSKKIWEAGAAPNIEAINMGSFQRIADACESMAANHDDLRRDRDWYKKCYEDEKQKRYALERKNAALRGVITKLKAKAK